jgi:phosphopantothenoylcysteine decarboxylase/phosphopantothenate--cysteine ligase
LLLGVLITIFSAISAEVIMLEGKKVLLVITGGIAAYKSLELIRLLQINKASVVPVMTQSAQQFLKPLSVAAIAGSKVYTELFDLTAEVRNGPHRIIQVCRHHSSCTSVS